MKDIKDSLLNGNLYQHHRKSGALTKVRLADKSTRAVHMFDISPEIKIAINRFREALDLSPIYD
jgi:hypothetical protein